MFQKQISGKIKIGLMNARLAAAVTVIIAVTAKKKSKKRKLGEKKPWSKDWIIERPEKGASGSLISDLELFDKAGFHNLVRLSVEDFQWLLEKISPLIMHQDTHLRKAISCRDRLAVTLHFLATGKKMPFQSPHSISA